MRRRLTLPCLLMFLTAAACGEDLKRNELIIGGGSSETDGLKISSPAIWLKRGVPGVVYGLQQSPGKDSVYTYVLIVQGDEQRKSSASYSSSCKVNGSAVTSQGSLEINSLKVEFTYHGTFTPDSAKPGPESLTVNGQELDLSKGRTLRVDLSGTEARWTQEATPLPKSPSWPIKTTEVEAQARELLKHLEPRKDRNP